MVAPAENGRGLRWQWRDDKARIGLARRVTGIGHEKLDLVLFQVVDQVMPMVDLDLHHQLGQALAKHAQRIL
ncbi:hypothetical protein D9M73_238280 [compost metagenome]